MVTRERIDTKFRNLFSVASPNQLAVKSRAIVRHDGDDNGSGVWTCSKDVRACMHIKWARDYLRQLMQEDPEAYDDDEMAEDTGVFESNNIAHTN